MDFNSEMILDAAVSFRPTKKTLGLTVYLASCLTVDSPTPLVAPTKRAVGSEVEAEDFRDSLELWTTDKSTIFFLKRVVLVLMNEMRENLDLISRLCCSEFKYSIVEIFENEYRVPHHLVDQLVGWLFWVNLG